MAEPLQSSGDGGLREAPDLAGVSNVLLQSPSIGRGKTETCHRLLGQTDPAETHVLVVTFTKSPSEWIDEYNEYAGEPPARGSIVAVSEAVPTVDDDTWTVEHVANGADLTALGIKLSNQLSTLVSAAAAEDGEVAVCFDSVTALCQYATVQGAFRFLHVVTGRVKTAGGLGLYHIDPAAHDNQELATLTGLFDAVVEVEEDGTIAVQR